MERMSQDALEPADVAGEVDWVTDLASAASPAETVHFPLEELSVVPREEGPAAEWLRGEEEAEVAG
jgi:hypothetical protein